jgi:hypothetical protein
VGVFQPIALKNMFRVYFIISIVLIGLLSACEKEITIDLPPLNSELVVECYLTPGYPYVLSLSETISYFNLIGLPTIDSAVVTITHNGLTDTLQYIDSIGVYFANRFVVAGDTGAYDLYINDTISDRIATATAKLLPIIPIDTVIYIKNDSAQASVLTYFTDNAITQNYYKYYVARLGGNAPDSLLTRSFSDLIFSGQQTVAGTAYDYPANNEVLVRIYNISREYYEFLETSERASFAAQGSFARPARIISNINNGTGIFTVLSYDERRIQIE